MKLPRQMSAAVLLLCVALGTCVDKTDLLPRKAVSSANNAFSKSLFQALGRYPGNIFYSPLSAHTVLSMAWLGAAGETARQMTSGLHLPAEKDQVANGYRELLAQLQSANKDVTMDIANKIYVKEGVDINKRFQRVVSANFQAESQEINFQRPVAAARTINQWVEQKTRQKIKDLISPDSLDSSSLMILVNAIYFKGKWLTEFKPGNTKLRRFYMDSKNSREIQMMETFSEFPYAYISDLKAKVLQLPYVGDRISMLILLPDEDQGVNDLETHLARVDLSQVLGVLYNTDVRVILPKFRLEITSELNGPLMQLGMTAMFGVNANFSNIAKHNLVISRVVQKAFIEVSEEGSEAAAASGVQIVALSGAPIPARPTYFTADHPFLFYIVDEESGTVLFAGRFSSPNLTQ